MKMTNGLKITQVVKLNDVEQVLREATEIKYFVYENSYKGKVGELLSEKELQSVLEDVKEGQAKLWKIGNTHELQYTIDCKWEIK